jgi:cytochrome c peroxidase
MGGKDLSQSDGRSGTTAGVNESFDTGVIRRDQCRGWLAYRARSWTTAQYRRFNVPSLIGLKRTAPFFHENSAVGLDAAIIFYDSSIFITPAAAQIGGAIFFGDTTDITEFLQAVGEEPFGAPTITGQDPTGCQRQRRLVAF